MGGVEVFKNGQTLLEVGDDRAFDDLARRLGHQTAHTSQLFHLGWRTTGTGMAHHVDGVHLLLTAGFLVEFNGANALHHFIGNLVTALGPGINNLVVLLALGDQTVIILLLVFLGERSRVGDQFGFCVGDDHVVLAEGNTGTAGMGKTRAA